MRKLLRCACNDTTNVIAKSGATKQSLSITTMVPEQQGLLLDQQQESRSSSKKKLAGAQLMEATR